MPRSVLAFGLATVLPVPLLLAGALFGGWASLWALLYITLFIAAVDEFLPAMGYAGRPAERDEAHLLSQILVGVHFLLLFVVVWSLAGGGPGLFSASGVTLFVATGLYFGQVSNSNAHELIHRGARPLRLMGRWVYISLLFGHHASAHPMVHHSHVATPLDPNTARYGESLYRFFPRAWIGSFKAGLAVEKRRLAQKGQPVWSRANPYVSYIAGAAGLLLVSAMIAGGKGVAVHLALAFFAQWQLMVSDYVQHYGLQRAQKPDGTYVPVDATHSWNAPHWFSALWMLNAPRHSDHHANPNRSYAELTLPQPGDAPMLPYALPTMGAIALSPRTWRRVMHPQLDAWRDDQPKAPPPSPNVTAPLTSV